MRTGILAACGLTVSLGVAVAPSQAQSLAELAKVEAAHRKAVKANAAVLTNADLRPSRSSTEGEQSQTGIADAPTVPTAASVVAGPDVAAEASTDEPHTEVPVKAREKRGEQYWRGRAADYDGRLTRLRNDVAAIRGRVRALDAQIAIADEGADAGHLRRERTEATATLERVRQSLAFLRKEFEDFQAFAARKEVDPAWLR